MPEPVKRTYNSPRRKQQAEATRSQILRAAQPLFEERGYSAATMQAIAADAGVALKTVYLAFESKSGVLRALWHLLLRGDEDDVAVASRRWYQEVLEEPDPVRKLRLNARNARAVKQRVGSLLGVIRSGAPGDPDVGALWARIQSDFYDNQRTIVATIEEQALAPGLDVTRATDILWTLNHPDVWLLLVGERGWTADEFERWFGDVSVAQLVAG
ncbi:MAG TPA: TetR family transcriptional regulator [Solirubrobacteraceae bacterium]|nr:TetR family transcriptional regulator [Solirubrobacteraceae bacterium]